MKREKREAHRAFKAVPTYEEWEYWAAKLDELDKHRYAWKYDISSPLYQYRSINEKLEAMHQAFEDGDEIFMEQLFRSGMSRFAGRIGRAELYGHLYYGSKALIEEYNTFMISILECLVRCWEVLGMRDRVWKIESARQTIGRTALVLQGGSLFGLCHLGVMKGLQKQGLLPRIILGMGAGAVEAGLVAPMTEVELEEFLDKPDIIADALKWKEDQVPKPQQDWSDRFFGESSRWFDLLVERFKWLWSDECMLDKEALLHCVDTQLGDITFHEAQRRSRREVNITIACDIPGTPNLLNYCTAPNVLIRSAVRAAMISDFDKATDMILEKSVDGDIQHWSINDETPEYRAFRRRRDGRAGHQTLLHKDQAIDRATQMFNVNHFVVSQTRPYFMALDQQIFSLAQAPRFFPHFKLWLRSYIAQEIRFYIRQLGRFIQLPQWLQKLIMDTRRARTDMTIIPDIGFREVDVLFRNPKKETVEHWMDVGEKSVWPYVAALRVRCNIEFCLQRHSDFLRGQDPTNWFLAQRGRDVQTDRI